MTTKILVDCSPRLGNAGSQLAHKIVHELGPPHGFTAQFRATAILTPQERLERARQHGATLVICLMPACPSDQGGSCMPSDPTPGLTSLASRVNEIMNGEESATREAIAVSGIPALIFRIPVLHCPETIGAEIAKALKEELTF